MRLVCPNCDAKYEVPDDAIPDGGRDVQCSACGHAWFQLPPEVEAAAEEEAALFGDDLPAAPDADPAAWPEDADDAALAAAIGGAVAGESGPAPAAEAEAVTEPPAAVAPRQELDDDVRSLLREEAEREAEARRAEAQRAGARQAEAEGQMQVQPDLGVDAAAPAGAALSPTQRRLAMLKGENPDAPPPEPPKPAARRDLLPDVEEINSTLQPGNSALDADVDALPDLTRQRSSFRSGFFMMILLLVIAAAIYVMAPQLAEQFPSLKPPLDSYVSFVDGLRIWLNAKMDAATAMLTGERG